MTVAFLVSAHVRCDLHERLLRNCLLSIARFHPDVPIVVCADDCDEERVAKYSAMYTMKVDNPFPRSGEYGSLHVAAHFPIPNVAYIVYIHDSTVLRRAFLKSELHRAQPFVPLWDTGNKAVQTDPCEQLIVRHIAPQVKDTPLYTKWVNVLHSPRRTVYFGCMCIGTPQALKDIWNTGLQHIAPYMHTRMERCRMERLLCCAAIVAGVAPSKPLIGNIFKEINAFQRCSVDNMIRWDAPAHSMFKSPVTKMWVGR